MKRITIKDIARKVRVSESTVSRALQDNPAISLKTREKVKAVALELGYQHDRIKAKMRQDKGDLVAIVQPYWSSIDGILPNPFLLEMTSCLAHRLQQEEMKALVISSLEPNLLAETIIDEYLTRDIAGFLLLTHSPDCLNKLCENDIPLAIWGSSGGENTDRRVFFPIASASSNNYETGRTVAEYLMTAAVIEGRTNYLFIGDRSGHEAQLRFCGFRDALRTEERKDLKELSVKRESSTESLITELKDYFSNESILTKLRAIFCECDVTALTVISVLQDIGLNVPDDIMVIGHDDTFIARYSNPPLTTVRQNVEIAAALMIESLVELISNGVAKKFYFNTELIVRKTA